MLEYLKKEANLTLTENGAVTYGSTGSECLDLFATIGALRRQSDEEIIKRFIRAFMENPDTAMKLLFFARDIRGGLGERRVFRTILKWLAVNQPESVRKNLEYIAEYGRFDDLLTLMGTPVEKDMIALVKEQLDQDLEVLNGDEPVSLTEKLTPYIRKDKDEKSVSLLAKWLPSVNASNAETKMMGKKMAKALGYSEAEYRKILSALRAKIRIIENNLREKDYTFDYDKQPSRAMFKYRKAFARNDAERYSAFINAVSAGEAKLNAANVSPYELVEPYLGSTWSASKSLMRNITQAEKDTLNATWASMPDFGGEEDALAVIDTSGSMYWGSKPLPASVALSLGLYFAERNKGAFRNHFIEFSAQPQLIEIKGESFADRLRYVASFNQVANTNLEAVFDLILRAAVKNRVPQNELPAKLIIISDMEFDMCVNNASSTIFENAKKRYESFGYKLPQIVFWNVASRNKQQPITKNERGVALISGVTPRIFSMVAGGELSPYTLMMEVIGSERYAKIVA